MKLNREAISGGISQKDILMKTCRIVSLTFAIAFALESQADPLNCDPARMNCSPLVACIEETGEVFRGSSFGIEEGPLAVETDLGVICSGNWKRNFIGIGLAEFTCSDGRGGQSAFTWFEPETGTAVGSGRFNDGTVVKFWSGNNLDRYFSEIDPAEAQRMACAVPEMLISNLRSPAKIGEHPAV